MNNFKVKESLKAGLRVVILHFSPFSEGKISGMSYSVPALVAAQNRQEGVNAALVVTRGTGTADGRNRFPVYHLDSYPVSSRGLAVLPEPFSKPDIAVFHSTYIYSHGAIAKNLRRQNIPYIIVPRGGMTIGAQKKNRLKKVIGNRLFYRKMVDGAVAINCLTEGEAKSSAFWGKDIFVVGNGVDLPPKELVASPGTRQDINAVFIGRLDIYHKGLDRLFEALAIAKEKFFKGKMTLKIFGPSVDGSVERLQRLISARGLNQIVRLEGPVTGKEKENVLREADVFVMTSRFEGHPMAVLEALAYGVPCVLTQGTNMAMEVENAKAGWRVGDSPTEIKNGLERIIENKNRLAEMGRYARLLAEKEYSWDNVAKRSLAEYARLIH